MLFAKALSILFSLFAGLESAKGALYHYVCGKGKDRAFPYLAELKQEFVQLPLKDIFTWCPPSDVLQSCLFDSAKARKWQNDLYFTVGGFTVKCTIIDEGILYQVSDFYDWHKNHIWTIPGELVEKLPKFVVDLALKAGFTLDKWQELTIEESKFSSLGTSFYHKGQFIIDWKDIESSNLYCNL